VAGLHDQRVLMSARIAGPKEHRGEIVGTATWPAIIDHATQDRLVGAARGTRAADPNYCRPRIHPLAGLLHCRWCGGPLVTYLQPRQGRGYGRRKDGNLLCPGRVRIAAEPLEAYLEGYVIDQWRNPEAIKIAQSDGDRIARIREIIDEMRQLQEQKNEALRMKLRGTTAGPFKM
jgi:site-specific DNA recombinase